MQLRHFFAILQRFSRLIIALPLVVIVLSLGVEFIQPQQYQATARLMVTQAPNPQELTKPFQDVNLNYSWFNSQFVLDDLLKVVTSLTFAQDVTAELAQQNLSLGPEEVSESLTASTYYRAVTIEAKAKSPEMVVKLLNAAITVFQRNGLKYWDRVPGGIEGNGIKVVVLNPASKAKLARSKTKLALDLVLRTGLALVAALGLAFLAHYLDDSLRDPLQTEEYLGLPLLGVIPQE